MFYENQTMKEVLQDKTIETVKDLLFPPNFFDWIYDCLLYTSDAADD